MPHRSNSASDTCPQKLCGEFDPKHSCFIVRRSILFEVDATPDGFHERILEEAEAIRQNPVPGLARLLEVDAVDQGSFELLPGRSLSNLLDREGALSEVVWHALADQLLTVMARASGRKGLELCFHPASISVWRWSRSRLVTAFGAYAFDLSDRGESLWERWERWSGHLNSLLYFMATGDRVLDPAKISPQGLLKNDALRDKPTVRWVLEQLFTPQTEKKRQLEDYRHLLAAADEKIQGSLQPFADAHLSSLPTGDPRIPWMLSEHHLPIEIQPSMRSLQVERPNVLSAVDVRSQANVRLHILPPATTLGLAHQKLLENAWKYSQPGGRSKPFCELTDRWHLGGCQVFAEAIPDGCRLEQLLDRDKPLASGVVIEIGRKIHAAISRAERLGMEIPSLHPNEVFLTPQNGEMIDFEDFSWLRARTGPAVRLRVLPAHYLHRKNPAELGDDPMGKSIRAHLGHAPVGGFVDIMARLLGEDRLQGAEVSDALQTAANADFCDVATRHQLLNQLAIILHDAGAEGSKGKIVSMFPHDPKTQWATVGAAALVSVVIAFFVMTAGPRAVTENFYASGVVEAISPEAQVDPPKELLPVSGVAAQEREAVEPEKPES